MGRLTSLFVVMSLLALAVMWLPATNPEKQLVEVTEIATREIAASNGLNSIGPAVVSQGQRTFSPDKPLYRVRDVASLKAVSVVAANDDRTEPALELAKLMAMAPVPMRASRARAEAERERLQEDAVKAPTDKFILARQLQTSLKAAGCYWGEVDGDWGPGSRRAMRQYMKAVNASLPVDEPDDILLKLVQRSSVEDCMPPAILAHRRSLRDKQISTRRTTRLAEVPAPRIVSAPVEPASKPAPLPGRMAVGAAIPDAPLLRTPPVVVSRPAPSSEQVEEPRRRARRPASVNDDVIVYRAARRTDVTSRQRSRQRSNGRRPRNIFETSWARQAFRSD
ncbi:MAG: hypothetical protein RLZ98_3072 [Pseudomonadota bacterium]|jgi:peptidoglycan hydrolase-like protein with peptidoglycan-binding domain